jgi:hypothetical protein
MEDLTLPSIGANFKRLEGNSQRAFLKTPYSCPPFWADVVNSCWLSTAHARPAHTSPKKFKHP